jgi:hypothetical protein
MDLTWLRLGVRKRSRPCGRPAGKGARPLDPRLYLEALEVRLAPSIYPVINTIAGNTLYGVAIFGGGNVVQGNRIGTDATGTRPLGNGTGVSIFGSSDNAVGGTAAGAGNIISGNRSEGVLLTDGAGFNTLSGNFIGTDATGTAPLSNGAGGVYIVNSSNNVVGGVEAGAGNLISGNQDDGVLVRGDFMGQGSTGNAILRNAIFANGNLGIDLTDGGNHNQPAPAVTSATFAGGVLTVQGTLQAQPLTTYTVELFVNGPGDGSGQGERFLASLTVPTGADGSAAFTLSLAVAVDPGDTVTATATDPGNNTSPFSNAALVTAPALAAVPAAVPSGTSGAVGVGWVAPPPGAAPPASLAPEPPLATCTEPAAEESSAADSGPPWPGLDLFFEAFGRGLEDSGR